MTKLGTVDPYTAEGLKAYYGASPLCLGCGASVGVEFEDARTQYDWDGEGNDPNIPKPLCRVCAKQHHDQWDSMWADHYRGLL